MTTQQPAEGSKVLMLDDRKQPKCIWIPYRHDRVFILKTFLIDRHQGGAHESRIWSFVYVVFRAKK